MIGSQQHTRPGRQLLAQNVHPLAVNARDAEVSAQIGPHDLLHQPGQNASQVGGHKLIRLGDDDRVHSETWWAV
jgi:hypothetical protein